MKASKERKMKVKPLALACGGLKNRRHYLHTSWQTLPGDFPSLSLLTVLYAGKSSWGISWLSQILKKEKKLLPKSAKFFTLSNSPQTASIKGEMLEVI